MKKPTSSTPRKAAAARENGRKGGTKNPDISRWNALRHALNARLGIHDGKHLPEYGVYAALHAQVVKLLSPLSILDLITINKFIADLWRLHRAFRFELSETEKPGNGMLSPGMHNLLRYSNSANRQFAESYARILELSQRKQTVAAAQLAAAAASDLDGGQQTPSKPAAAPASPQTASVIVGPFDTAPIRCKREDEIEREQPTQSAPPAIQPSASAHPGDPDDGIPDEVIRSAAAAEATPSTAAGEEEKGDSPGED